MNRVLLFSYLLLAGSAYGQVATPPVAQQPVPSTTSPKPRAPRLPMPSVRELQRLLLAACAMDSQQYAKAFVYRAYMNAGADFEQVTERLTSLTRNQGNRAVLFRAIQEWCGADLVRMRELLHTSLGLPLPQAQTLAQYINKAYPLPQEEPGEAVPPETGATSE